MMTKRKIFHKQLTRNDIVTVQRWQEYIYNFSKHKMEPQVSYSLFFVSSSFCFSVLFLFRNRFIFRFSSIQTINLTSAIVHWYFQKTLHIYTVHSVHHKSYQYWTQTFTSTQMVIAHTYICTYLLVCAFIFERQFFPTTIYLWRHRDILPWLKKTQQKIILVYSG